MVSLCFSSRLFFFATAFAVIGASPSFAQVAEGTIGTISGSVFDCGNATDNCTNQTTGNAGTFFSTGASGQTPYATFTTSNLDFYAPDQVSNTLQSFLTTNGAGTLNPTVISAGPGPNPPTYPVLSTQGFKDGTFCNDWDITIGLGNKFVAISSR
jgi:hypothetical protein